MIISDKKYACETCIKGHRSSSCKHFDRPLFEIKKKGRPITQCEHCRELRKTKQVHVKCICEGKADGSGAASKKVNKPGFESAAFPNGLPMQASGTLVATPALASEGDPAACNCSSTGGSCHCCTPKKTHRRSRTTSGHPSAQPGSSSDGNRGPSRLAELRPVLPGPPPPEMFLGSAGYDPSRGLYHNYARHDAYSPYGRAYDMHQQSPNAALTMTQMSYGSNETPSMSVSPTQDVDPNQTRMMQFPTTCNCGPGCQCRGCSGNIAGGSCSNPDTCVSCLDCSITSLQPYMAPSVGQSNQQPESNIDDWLRSLPHGAPGSSLLDDDLMASSNSLTWNPTMPLIQDPSYSSMNFEGDEFTATSIFRLPGTSSGSGYPYLDPNFLDGVRFDTPTELRPRSHSPSSAMHLARQGTSLDMGLGTSSEAQVAAYRPSGRMQGNSNFFANVAGMRSAPQLNLLNTNPQLQNSASVSPVSGQYAPSNSDSDTSLRDTLRY